MTNIKQIYSDFQDEILDYKAQMHVRVVHLFDKHNSYGGATIAYRPLVCNSVGYPQGKFAEVAIAWCNPRDRYDRKLGELIAVRALQYGNCVSMPIYATGTPVLVLKSMFEPMLDANLGI